MKQEKIITHPITGETFNQARWAKKLGISPSTLAERLKKLPVEKALSPEKLLFKYRPWSEDEDEYLASCYQVPNLFRRWNATAKKRGWLIRSRQSLNNRVALLKDRGIIVISRRDLDESSGWISLSQLAECLQVSNNVVYRWGNCGLSTIKDNGINKLHLKNFVHWATTPTGAGEVAKSCSSNAIALNWLLIQIGNWLENKNS